MNAKCSTGVMSVLALSMTLLFATSTTALAEKQEPEKEHKEHKEQKERPRKDEGASEKRKPRERAPEPKEVRPAPARNSDDMRERRGGRPTPGRGGEPGAVKDQVRPVPATGFNRPGGGWKSDRNGSADTIREKEDRGAPSNQPAYRKRWGKPEQDRNRPAVTTPAARDKQPYSGRPAFTLPPDVRRTPGGSAVLPKEHADNVLRQVNSARSNHRGLNGRPVPTGRVSTRRDGGVVVEASRGRKYDLRPDGTLARFSARGRTADFRPNGRIRSLDAGNIRIRRGVHNERRIVTVRPDRAVLVSIGPRRGYLERRVAYNDVTLVRRTYVVNQTTYTQVYTPRYYNGMEIQVFLPRAYYPAAYYGWAVDPWGRPVRYSWGWNREPWYGYYGSYYHPASVYPSASAWLTDYILADTLRSAYYDEGGEQPVDPDLSENDVDYPISPAVKGMLVREVSRQLAEEREAARRGGYGDWGIPWALREPDRMFVVSTPLDVTSDNGEACGLAAGDVLRVSAPIDGSGTADLRVMSRRSGDCAAYSTVSVGLSDLQEMNNSMRVRLYAGLDQLRRQRDDYIPSVPPEAMSAPRPSEAAALPPSNENVLAMLRSQQTEADQAEQQLMDSAFVEAPAGPPPSAESPPPAEGDDAPAEDGYDYQRYQ